MLVSVGVVNNRLPATGTKIHGGEKVLRQHNVTRHSPSTLHVGEEHKGDEKLLIAGKRDQIDALRSTVLLTSNFPLHCACVMIHN